MIDGNAKLFCKPILTKRIFKNNVLSSNSEWVQISCFLYHLRLLSTPISVLRLKLDKF